MQKFTPIEGLEIAKKKIKEIKGEYLNLRYLNLETLPIEISNLENIKIIDLRGNKLTDISILKDLTSIISLDLRGNKITHLPQFLLQWQTEILWKREEECENDNAIFLDGNPLVYPPTEIIKQGNEAIRNYFSEIEKSGKDYLYEAKLLILGDGGAGKTTFQRKFQDDNAPLPDLDTDSTKGIEIHPYSFLTEFGKEFKLNIWDFGGQVIYHATHQFFLTKRSLYVLVVETRKENTDLGYWLQLEELFGEDSPIIIIQNQRSERTRDLNIPNLKSRYNNLKDFFSLDLTEIKELSKLRQAIKYYAQNLTHIGEEVPKNWLSVRKEIEDLKSNHNFIDLNKFLGICLKHNISERKASLHLSRYLHDLGVFLHFQDNPVLKYLIILRNDWAIEAVYKILDNDNIKNLTKGRFNFDNIYDIWSNSKYKDLEDELLELMIKFELCYQISNSKNYIIPQLLPIEKPNFELSFERALNIKFTYNFMPRGLVSRLTVRLHKYIFKQELIWREGVILFREDTKAEIIEFYDNEEITIKVAGKYPKELITIIVDELNSLNESYKPLLKVEKWIPCHCTECNDSDLPHFYKYNDLIRRKDKNKSSVECEQSYENVLVDELLDNFFSKQANQKSKMIKIFLSYAQEDKSSIDELNKHLSSLRRNEKVNTWSDNEIIAGQEWDNSIKKELEAADIILLCVSPDFLDVKKKYIWDIEVEKAMERHNKNGAIVIPIILRYCIWTNETFSKINALPRKGKPISSWMDKDEAWYNVANELELVINNLLSNKS